MCICALNRLYTKKSQKKKVQTTEMRNNRHFKSTYINPVAEKV